MTLVELLAAAEAPVIDDLIATGSRRHGVESRFDNRPTWDNIGIGFDNRPTWDNWNKTS